MNTRLALLALALLSAVVACCVLLLSVEAHAASAPRYRRPYAVLIGLSPHDTETFKCHNRNFKLPRIYLFGGCKEVGNG